MIGNVAAAQVVVSLNGAIAASWSSNPLVLASAAGLPALVVGYLGYRRSKRGDEVASRLGVATGSAQEIQTAFEGLNLVVAGLKEIIVTLQTEARVDQETIRGCAEAVRVTERELNRMYRKHGNGDA